MTSCKPAFLSSASIVSSANWLLGSRLKRRVPLNKTGSWGTTVSLLRRILRSIFPISIPSISIDPSKASTILGIVRLIVDFPAPVLPTSPTFYPASTLKESPLRTSGRFFRYFNLISLNSISPFKGQTLGSTLISAVYFSYGQIFCIVIAHLAWYS